MMYLALGLTLSVASQVQIIVDITAGSTDHSTLVAAVKAAGLVDALNGKGPLAIFAPVNDAFGKLPAGTVESLLKPENKGQLTAVLTYHVVAGNLDATAVMAAIEAGQGKAVLTTLQGGQLTATLENGKGGVDGRQWWQIGSGSY